MSEDEHARRGIDLDKPNAARVYDYILGGQLNYAVDRMFAEQVLAAQPNARERARLNRQWLRRAIRFGMDHGIRQFLDIGSGMPTVGHVHEVAQAVDPRARVVYVDNEPVAVAHSEIVLEDNDNAAMVHADAEFPDDVLEHDVTEMMLDLDQPVMVVMALFVHFIPDERNPAGLIAAYRDALAPGSHLALTHLTNDFAVLSDPRVAETMRSTQNHIYPRSRDEVLALFDGFELVEPGLTTSANWRPDRLAAVVDPEEDGLYAGVGIKPAS